MRLPLQVLAFSVILASSAAASTYTITGTVADSRTGDPVPDANIVLSGTPMGAVSLDHGQYRISRIPAGDYEMEVGVIGYAPQKIRLRIDRDEKRDFMLDSRPVRINPVLVTATRSQHLRSAVTACTDVLTRDAWFSTTDGTAGEILNTAGNVFVKDYGGFSGLKTLSIRGSGGAQVLVLLDGQRLNTAQSGIVDLNAIPSEALERIEIVRGGHSALMGSDAMGGAVHLVTRNPENGKKASFGAGHTAGSFGTGVSNAFGSFGLRSFRCFLLVNRIQSRGDFAYRLPGESVEKTRENNDVRADALFFKSNLDAGRAGQFQLGMQAFKSDRGTADHVSYTSSLGRSGETRRFANLDWRKSISSSLVVSAGGGVQTDAIQYHSLYENDSHDIRSSRAECSVQWTVRPFMLFQSGLEWSDDNLNSTKFQSQRRTAGSLYAELEASERISSLEWKINPAVRLDRFSGNGMEACPKIGAMIRTGRVHTAAIRANAGRSFRMPAFNDLFWPEQIWPGYGGTRGNPALKPETGWYGDAGLAFEKTEPFYFQAELAFFENRMENLIDWQSDADFVFAPVNVGKARIHGVESRVSFKTPGGGFQASISPCWMRSVDMSVSKGDGGGGGDRLLPYRPEWKIDADAGFSLKALHFDLRHQTVGRRFTTADNGKALPAYPLWNAGASFRSRFGAFTANTRFQVNNLAGRRISNMDGYPLPGREYRISFEMHY